MRLRFVADVSRDFRNTSRLPMGGLRSCTAMRKSFVRRDRTLLEDVPEGHKPGVDVHPSRTTLSVLAIEVPGLRCLASRSPMCILLCRSLLSITRLRVDNKVFAIQLE